MGLRNSQSFGRIIIHPANNNIVFAAVLGSAWGYGPDRGVYRTTNGGKSWEKVLYINERTGAADIDIDPQNLIISLLACGITFTGHTYIIILEKAAVFIKVQMVEIPGRKVIKDCQKENLEEYHLIILEKIRDMLLQSCSLVRLIQVFTQVMMVEVRGLKCLLN